MRSEEVVIRRAEFKDADVIAGIHWRSRAEAMPWLATTHTALETRGWIARVVLKKEDVYVATLEGKIVAYMSLQNAGRTRQLSHLYVHPDYQRRGIGTLLLTRARRLMPDGFTLWVFQRNAAARAFYEKHGCIVVRETDGRGNEAREADVEYAWNLAVRSRHQ